MKQTFVSIIEKAFAGMQERHETFVIVRLFDHIANTTPLPHDIMRVDLIKEDDHDKVRLLYRDHNFVRLPFTTMVDKRIAVRFLQLHKALPSAEEFLQARSLANTPGIVSFLGCGCEE
jgi:hypothetical protein